MKLQDTLLKPVTAEEREQCRVLAETIGRMHITHASLTRLDRQPAARVCYENGCAPASFWSKWLWAQIGTFNDHAWLARLCAIIPGEYALYFVPRPDTIDISLAAESQLVTCDNQLKYLKLGIVHPPHQCLRTFCFTH